MGTREDSQSAYFYNSLSVQVVSVFLVYNKVSVIMASGRELCYVLLLGILASYSVPFFALARPNIVTCAILRFSPLTSLLGIIVICLGIINSQLWVYLENMLMMPTPNTLSPQITRGNFIFQEKF